VRRSLAWACGLLVLSGEALAVRGEATASSPGVGRGDAATRPGLQELRQRWGPRRARGPASGQALPEPNFADVHYGPHPRQVLDLWQATSKSPSPLVLYIHGGGFVGGDKRTLLPRLLHESLQSGYSVAAINYRLCPEVTFPTPMLDVGRAIQFLRHNAGKWNLDPKRIASTGGSAGGGISLWLGFHDDLADPNSQDPIARESTRLTCLAVDGAQTSYDPKFAEQIGLKGLLRHPSFPLFYGLRPDEFDTPRARRLCEQASAITHLTPDDPPVLLDYGVPDEPVDERTPLSAVVHHPRFGLALKDRMEKLGIECIVQYPGGSGQGRVSKIEFIRKHFERVNTPK